MGTMPLPPARSPRILIVTPEIARLPEGIAANANKLRIGTGPRAERAASLVNALFMRGVDVHVALPDFRCLFRSRCRRTAAGKSRHPLSVCKDRVHLAEDRHLFYWKPHAPQHTIDSITIALAFQREVINHIVPIVQPDLIHCLGWMTGLIPAMARERDIPCLFSVQTFHTGKACLNTIEDRGIDAAAFWRHLYYERFPSGYEATRDSIPVDFMASGILASGCSGIDSPVPLRDIIAGRSVLLDDSLRRVLSQKWEAGNAIDLGSPPAALLRAAHDGNGFLFDDPHQEGWPIDAPRTPVFFPLPVTAQYRRMHRIMSENTRAATQQAAPDRYMQRYEKMLCRPLRPEGQAVFNQAASLPNQPRKGPSILFERRPSLHDQGMLSGSQYVDGKNKYPAVSSLRSGRMALME
jgi:Starch synthase catalytic domain